MENIQGQFQKVIKDGKDKILNSQEMTSLRFKMSESEDERSLLISEVGEIAYRKIRDGQIADQDFKEIIDKIVEFDKAIYRSLKTIEEKTKERYNYIVCSCGAQLSSADKFCVSCGERVAEEVSYEGVDLVICDRCGEDVPRGSSFCNCCGYKLEEGEIEDVL